MGGPAAVLNECYPYGVFAPRDSAAPPRVGVRVGDSVLDAGAAAAAGGSPLTGLLQQPTLDRVLAAGPATWQTLHQEVAGWAAAGDHRHPLTDVTLHLPFTVADYVDFYASEHHATNLGRLLRPGEPPLQPNWRYQPVGYHGRAGTVVVSGTPLSRPHGHVRNGDGVTLRPTAMLDVEVEVGFVVGTPSRLGHPVPVADFEEHVFGLVLVNDWSARDIQRWETVPLGPFLGKSFLTSVSPWVVPLAALAAARVPPPSAAGALSAYLVEPRPWGLDIDLELWLNGELVSRPPYRTMHWSPAQLLAHLTVNGAALRTGDLFASGTVSGPGADEVGSLIERYGGNRFLGDGDVVAIRGTAPGPDGSRMDLGEVTGVVVGSA